LGLNGVVPVVGPEGASLVPTLRSGVAWEFPLAPLHALTLALGHSVEPEVQNRFQAGMEYAHRSSYFIRVGYQGSFERNAYEGELSGLTLGAGLSFGTFGLDYAYVPSGDLGSSHRFGLSFSLGGESGGMDALRPGGAASAGQGAVKPRSEESENVQGTSQGLSPNIGTVPSMEGTGSSDPTASGGNPSGSLDGTAKGSAPAAGAPEGGKDSLTVRFKIPSDPAVQADTLLAQGRNEEAAALYQQAVEGDPRNAKAWWGLGSALAKTGRKAEAIRAFERALEIQPDNPPLREWLKKYKKQ
jgi:hypothetical protein